jgi:tetratricopeptide (TPR) repeat protein
VALYRAGRSADALESFRRVRARLVRELGQEPGPVLQELQRRILKGEGALVAPDAHPDAGGGGAPGRLPVPRQLPAAPQVFTGRVSELAELERVIDQSSSAVIAIDGMAGVGKTALALEVAHRAASRYPDGQLFIDLRGHSEGQPPLEVAEAVGRVLRALGLPGQRIPSDTDEQSALLRSRLADRKMLILLDNAAGEAQVTPLLPGASGCLVLVTSRRRLTALDDAHTVSLGPLPRDDAVALFHQAVGAGLVPEPPPGQVGEVVRLCGELPLAIRIAARRLTSHPSWSVADLLARLREHQRRLAELEVGQRSVTAALELSYQHLPADQQRTYRLLALHPGRRFDAYATCALTGTAATVAGRLLEQLLTVHLLQEPVPGRYEFHDLVRAHATAHADAGVERHDALSRLLDYYRHTAMVAMDAAHPYERDRRPRVSPADAPAPALEQPSAAAGWLDAELSNLLAVARLAADHGSPKHAVDLAGTIDRHLRARGRYGEAEALHRLALDGARAHGDRPGERRALTGLGHTCRMRGRYDEAVGHFSGALDIARAAGDRVGEVEALTGLGHLHWLHGTRQVADELCQRAREIARAIGDRNGELEALTGLSHVLWMQNRYESAAERYQQALEVARAIGRRDVELDVLAGLGMLERARGRYDEAADHFAQVLTTAREVGNRSGELDALIGLGRVNQLRGRYRPAEDYLSLALETAGAVGLRTGQLNALVSLGHTHRLRGHYRRAADRFAQALDLAERIGNRNWQFEAVNGLGRLHLATGDAEAARGCHQRALRLATDLAQQTDQARAHDGLAHAYHALGRLQAARRHWRSALEILTNLGADRTDDPETTTGSIRGRLADLDAADLPG